MPVGLARACGAPTGAGRSQLEAEHGQCAAGVFGDEFGDVDFAKFRDSQDMPFARHAGAVDLDVFHEGAKDHPTLFRRILRMSCVIRIQCHFAKSRVGIKLFPKRFESIDAKKKLVIEFNSC